MSSKTRTFFLSLTILAVLVFSAVGPTTVLADDGAPTTPSDTTGGGSDPNEVETDPQPTAEPIELVVEETPPPADPNAVVPTPENSTPVVDGGSQPPTEESAPVTEDVATPVVEAAAPPADTNILEQVPENTNVTVLDAQGQAQPLVTQESATAIEVTSDPIWCPAAQTVPTPGANGCTASFTSFDALLTELSGNAAYQQAGTIFVQQNAYAGGEAVIDFNSYDLSNIDNFDLAVTGGWNTTNNTIDPASSSTFNVSILIGSSANPWGGSLSLSNLSITNTNQTGLTLFSQGTISLDNVQVTNSVNGSGAELNAGGDVNIVDSRFERNRQAGAIVRAGGNVAIQNSNFSNPGTNRLQITGLDINSGGEVSLFDVIANANREVGANIVAHGLVSIGASFIGGSSFSGNTGMTTTTCPGSPSQFCGFGLQVMTPDSIAVSGVVANDNFLWGASLNAGQDVNIVDSIFNANTTSSPAFIDDTGLLVTSGGRVALTNVEANNNRLIGAVIDAVGNVTIINSRFSNNNGVTLSGGVTTFHGLGLQVTSDANIFLNGVTASGNTLFGAHLEAAGDVSIRNSFFNNNTTGSAADALGRGLEVISGGSVFMNTVTLDGNQLFGANIQAPGDVFLDFITATNNGTNGVEVDAACTFLNGGAFTGNGEYGLSLVNPALNQTGAPVFSGNGLGDIFPLNPPACPVVVSGGTGGGTGTGSSTSGGMSGNAFSNQPQFVSLAAISAASPMSKNLGTINSGVTLNSLFAGSYRLFGVSTALSSDATMIGLFTGKYAYIHSPFGLQIVLLQPAVFTNVWKSDAS